jgi:hypothetical protein
MSPLMKSSKEMSTNSLNAEQRAQKLVERLRPEDDMEKGGVKFDDGKTRDELLPPELEEAVAMVLAFGAKKYADRNWEKGMAWSRPYAATRRHLRNWFARRDFGHGPGKDRDSGYSDLAHAATNIAFLLAYEARATGIDDRP